MSRDLSETEQSSLRELIASFGDAYGFFQATGNFSELEEFLRQAKRTESLLQ